MRKDTENLALPAVLAVSLLLFLLVGGTYFARYLQRQIFVERTTQLVEITSQVQVNLSNALDSHWNYLTAAVNILRQEDLRSSKEIVDCVADLEGLLEMDRYSSMLMLLDSQGNCYDADGKHGVWSDIDQIAGGGERYTFISDSYIYQGGYWAFVQKLDVPLNTEDAVFTHVVLLKDVHTLTEYYNSTAYGNQSETYILKSNGTRMHDETSQGNTIRAYNVLKVLQGMEGQSYSDIRAALREKNTISTNFYLEGTEYYYCLTSLEQYDTLLLFLIPARFVASGTVNMVGTVIQTLLFLAVVLVVLLVLAVAAVIRQQVYHSKILMVLGSRY